jgi:hypothetical protein
VKGLIFIALDDRTMIRLDAIVAISELDEQDIDPRTGQLALGIPDNSVARIMTERATFYTTTPYDEIVLRIQEAMAL